MGRSSSEVCSLVTDVFTPVVKRAFGDGLRSIILYGSVLKESFDPRRSDVNVLIVVEANREAELRELGRAGRGLIRRNRITPLVLTREEFATSADVFPMEYLDIVETHRVVFGPDVTADLDLRRDNLRHQVEHQLRGSLVSLRQLAIASGTPRPFRKTLLRSRLEEWYGRLNAVLRGLLRLYTESAIPADPVELVRRINEALGLTEGPLLLLLRRDRSDRFDPVDLIDQLLRRLAQIVAIVDRAAGSDGGGR